MVAALVLSISVLLSACGVKVPKAGDQEMTQPVEKTPVQNETSKDKTTKPADTANPSENTGSKDTTPKPAPTKEELEKVQANEAGKVMVVMFHNFVESFTPTKSDKGTYTTTFDEFRTLLQTLYDKGYRLISFTDFINNRIDVPAGCIPMVFTFDDGTAGQFHLMEQDGKLVADPQSAVGIMEEFQEKHSDFGVKGTFYINLGNKTFPGAGTVEERLKYLKDKGFEIGNHTYTHVHLPDIKSPDKLQEEIGKNQKELLQLLPDYQMKTFSLPYGQASKDLKHLVEKGEFDGTAYQHIGIVEVGWDPSVPPTSKKFNPLAIHRVRSTGMTKVEADLDWWLNNISRKQQYISDGNPDTVSVPESKKEDIDETKLNGAQLITY